MSRALPPGLVRDVPGSPLTALAPMQDVTDLAFMGVIASYGAPDYFFTEFFRVHAQSRPERHILRSIDENATGRPVFAQLIGEDIPALVRTVEELLRHPIAGIDLNLGCPAPKVYKKNVGGGLLRDPERIGTLLTALRAALPCPFTVKMRVGFEDASPLERILEHVAANDVDLLTVHGRTVRDSYRGNVRYDLIGRAAGRVRCPVLANGNIVSASRARLVLGATGAAGVMIGRHAIRNPWIFRQCREVFAGAVPFRPTLGDGRAYVDRLLAASGADGQVEHARLGRMKKYLNFFGQSVDAGGAFLHAMRRAGTERELLAVCDTHLLAAPDTPMADEPYPGIVARPNCETAECSSDLPTEPIEAVGAAGGPLSFDGVR